MINLLPHTLKRRTRTANSPLQRFWCILCLAIFLLGANKSFAHKLILDAYVIGDLIEGELFFSTGQEVAHQAVQVLDETGGMVASITTDDEGLFSYAPVQAQDHTLFTDVGSGHVASITVFASALTDVRLATKDPIANAQAAGVEAQANSSDAELFAKNPVVEMTQGRGKQNTVIIDTQEVSHNVSQAVAALELAPELARIRGEVRQLRQEIIKSRERANLQQVLGGLGFILGLVGVYYYLAARRKFVLETSSLTFKDVNQ